MKRMTMHKVLWSFLIVLLCIPTVYAASASDVTDRYEKALLQIKSGDVKADFKALRIDCADSKHECQADPEEIKQMFSLLNERKFDQVLAKVNQALEKAYVDAELHYIAYIANTESGHKEKAEFHKAVIRGILDSIQENKHGQSEEDAFVVINVHEEYTFLRFSNMQVTKQSLTHKDGHYYDVIICKKNRFRHGTRDYRILQCRYSHKKFGAGLGKIV